MKKNVGKPDKFFRIILAAILVYLAYTGVVGKPWNIVLYVFAGIMAITALVGNCPLYDIVGMNTCKSKEQ